MTKKEKITDALVIAGLAAFAYYKYSRLTAEEKDRIHRDIKEIGKNILQEVLPEQVKKFIPTAH